MQNTKDTFYVALRNRLALVNPDRTCVVRGAARPAVLVAENELLPEADSFPETFVLQWSAPLTDSGEAVALDSVQCEIAYRTEGTALAAGMDRGRVLDAMDGELRAMLSPACATKQDFTMSPAISMATKVFWSDAALGRAVLTGSSLSRVATLTVFGFREAGER